MIISTFSTNVAKIIISNLRKNDNLRLLSARGYREVRKTMSEKEIFYVPFCHYKISISVSNPYMFTFQKQVLVESKRIGVHRRVIR